MKKLICILIVLAFLLCAACAEPASTEPAAEPTPAPTVDTVSAEPSSEPLNSFVVVDFEDGFHLELPSGWKYYHTSDEMARQGVLYCLSDKYAAQWLYIQRWTSDCENVYALKALIDRTVSPETSGVYSFNGTDFVIYDLAESDVSCCAALHDGAILNFVFTPQSDAAFMAIATQMISSFGVLEA